MTPKEKAKQLYDKMEFETKYNSKPSTVHGMCKKLALLCVDECIKEHCHESEHKDPLAQDRWIDYWQQVRKEISLL
tara:strand:- start:692 stop:919 length:228 start_codon:yes stop_codon:yes gene_type:complete